MTVPDRQTFASIDPRWQIQITDDGSPTLVECASGNSMHSGCGAVAETLHVYLHNSGVAARLQAGMPTRVLEVGLGSGLGFLLTANFASQHFAPLHYVALEQLMPPPDLIRQLDLERYGINGDLIDSFCKLLDQPMTGSIEADVSTNCHLRLEIGDATAWNASGEKCFDAIYFDPFSPNANPALWTTQVFRVMHRLLVPDGKLVSYCVNRRVRDTLKECGFRVERVRGPIGGKREVLVASPSSVPLDTSTVD